MTSTHQPLTEQQLDRYAELAITADHDGIKVDPTIVTVLVDEVRHLQHQRNYLLRQLAKRDTTTGAADRALTDFLSGDAEGAQR